MSGLEETVGKALAEAGIAPGDKVVAAVSGGPDSTALLRVLAALQEESRLVVSACIVDHGIRPREEIEEEISFVRGLCEPWGIRLEVARVPAGACAESARASGRGLEECARDFRLRLLQETARNAGARAVALGHTEDDVLETLLMRILQGSDVDGLRGIPAKRGLFIRPLLSCTRRQIIEYLEGAGQGWREDPSNRDTGFLRNRVRHLLTPLLEKDFPGYRTGLRALSRKLSLVSTFLHEQADLLPWMPSGSGFAIARQDFFGAAPAARSCSLLRLYDRFKLPSSPRRLPWRFLEPATGRSERMTEGWILRGHGAGLRMRGGMLFWGPDIASRGKKGYFIEVSDAENVAIRGGGVRLRLARSADKAVAGTGDLSILAGTVEPPLVLRSKRKGDEILLEGGWTSVKDLLAGWKVSASDRDRMPILADRKGVLAVLGGALGYRTRARAGALAGNRENEDRIVVYMESDMEEGREQQQR